jgi:hypothetical protein
MSPESRSVISARMTRSSESPQPIAKQTPSEAKPKRARFVFVGQRQFDLDQGSPGKDSGLDSRSRLIGRVI